MQSIKKFRFSVLFLDIFTYFHVYSGISHSYKIRWRLRIWKEIEFADLTYILIFRITNSLKNEYTLPNLIYFRQFTCIDSYFNSVSLLAIFYVYKLIKFLWKAALKNVIQIMLVSLIFLQNFEYDLDMFWH